MGPYQIVELVEKWKKSLNDILRMVLDKRLQWWVLKPSIVFSGQPQREHYDLIEPDIAVFFLTRSDSHMDTYYCTGEPCRYYLGDFVVFPEEVARVEAENPDLLKPITQQHEAGRLKDTGEPEEQIEGFKQIADFFGVTERQAKSYANIKDYPFITRSGSVLLRTIFDIAVFSPERLDFVSGAVCEGGCFQRLPEPVYTDGGPLLWKS